MGGFFGFRVYRDKFAFLRGDFNASSKNKTRATILRAMISRMRMSRVTLDHPTYHHFTGCGDSDSDLDLLLYGGEEGATESLDILFNFPFSPTAGV